MSEQSNMPLILMGHYVTCLNEALSLVLLGCYVPQQGISLDLAGHCVARLCRALFHLSWQGVFCLLRGHFIAGLGFMSLFLALCHFSWHYVTCLGIMTLVSALSLVSPLCHSSRHYVTRRYVTGLSQALCHSSL